MSILTLMKIFDFDETYPKKIRRFFSAGSFLLDDSFPRRQSQKGACHFKRCSYDGDHDDGDNEDDDDDNLLHNHLQVAMAMILMSIQRRLYNSYLEVKLSNHTTIITDNE